MVVDILPVQSNRSADPANVDEIVHAIETAQQGRLPTPAGADERGYPPFRDLDVDIRQGLVVTVKQVQVHDLQTGVWNGLRGRVHGTGVKGSQIDSVCQWCFLVHLHCSLFHKNWPVLCR